MRFKVLTALLLSTLSALAAPEASIGALYEQKHLDSIVAHNLFFFNGTSNAITAGEVKIGYIKIENQEGTKGTVLISAGRAESSLKFIEIAEDLLKSGYQKVFILDQRGQGFSSRLHSHEGVKDTDYEKVHLDEARRMTLDLRKFINEILIPQGQKPFLALGHITGVLPLTDYLQLFENESPFEKVVMVSPLMQIKTSAAKRFLFYKILKPLLPEDARVPFEKKKNTLGDFKTNNRTSSEARFNLVKRIIDLYPQSASISSTMRWASEIMAFQPQLLNSKHRIQTPILMLTAAGDELLVNSVSEEFCKNTDRNARCSYLEIPKARHWLLFEKDSIRNEALNWIETYFSNSNAGLK